MSTFGDHVHATWTGYARHGTKRFDSKKSNFSEYIFNEHYNILMRKIDQDSRGLDKSSLQIMEDEYNTSQRDMHNEIKKILANKNRGQTNRTILEALISSFNSEWNATTVAQIVDALQWDDNKETFVYAPQKTAQQIYSNKSSTKSSLPKITRWEDSANFHYVSKLRSSIEELYSALNKIPYKDALSTQDDKTLKIFIKELKNYEKVAAKILKGSDIETKLIGGTQKTLAQIREVANNIRFNYSDIDTVNKIIQAQFAEFLGNNLGKNLTAIAKTYGIQQIQTIFKDSFIGRGSGNTTASKYNVVTLNYMEVVDQIGKNADLANLFDTTESIKKDENGKPYLKYTFKSMGDPRAQKADIIFEPQMINQSMKFGISMKNISLKTGAIKGQNSSLMLYLLGASEICASKSNMGTQYLNILSKHGNEGNGAEQEENFSSLQISLGTLNNLREWGQEVLSLHILYSAFSGYGQLRNNQAQAQILAIYDKESSTDSVNRVHFFNIPLLIKQIWFTERQNQVLFPSISSILFENTFEEEYENFPRRITQVLIEARQKNINAIISAALLRQVVKEI